MQNKTGSGAPTQLDLSDQVEHHASAVTAIPKVPQSSSPAGHTLAACRSLQSFTAFLSAGLLGRAAQERKWLGTNQLSSSTMGAGPSQAQQAQSDLHWLRVEPLGCVCITLPSACATGHCLKLVRCLQLQQGCYILKMHRCWHSSAVLSCRARLSHGAAILTAGNRTWLTQHSCRDTHRSCTLHDVHAQLSCILRCSLGGKL